MSVRKAAERQTSGQQTGAAQDRQPGNVYLPNHEYFLSSADPCHHDRLPQPVRKREPLRHHIPGYSGNGSEYRGGGDLLWGDE